MSLQLPQVEGFMPHGMCYMWEANLLWTHVLSDVVIGLSYVAISVALAWLVWRSASERVDQAGPFERLPFWWMFLAFGLFIVACGVTHFFGAWTVWNPDYWASGGAKVVTAVASLATAVAFPPLIPRILRLVRMARTSEVRKTRLAEAHRELQDANARIRELDELKSRFFANVSHELRTPLALIAGPVQHRLSRADLDEEERSELESILRNTRTLRKHVDDLLDLALFEAGSLTLRHARGDLVALTRRVASHFDGLAEVHGIHFAVEADGSATATADFDKVERVLVNLLSNAFKFTPEGGTVRLRLETDETTDAVPPDTARFTVSDSGPGVPETMREAIFERFRQIDGGQIRAFGGTGLGLNIAREFVELHGGEISVDEAPEGGARFTILLPRLPDAADEEAEGDADEERAGKAVEEVDEERAGEVVGEVGEARSAPGEEGSERTRAHAEAAVAELGSPAAPTPPFDAGGPEILSGFETSPAKPGGEEAGPGSQPPRDVTERPPTVLIVEDNRDMGRFLLQILPTAVLGMWARDGREALRMAEETRPDVVLSDLVMEGMDGEELLGELRRRPELQHVPFVALTARADEESRLTLLRQGAQDFIEKPFVPAEVELRVSNWLAVSRARTLLRREVEVQEGDLEDLAREVTRHKRGLEDALGAVRVAREEEALASRAKSDFLAVVSHELRTPLTAIVGYVDLMLEEISGPINEKQRRQLQRIRRSSDQLLGLIEQILDFSSLERGQMQIRLGSVDAEALVQDVADQVRPRAEEEGLELRVEVRDARVALHTDIGRVRQILLNLLTNAVKYTEDGWVAIRFLAEEETAVFEIEDTGIGIAPEDRGKIFEPFWQVDQSATRVVGGTGLGLSIARRLARRLGGDVTTRPRPGGGSVFEVRLPVGGPEG